MIKILYIGLYILGFACYYYIVKFVSGWIMKKFFNEDK